MNLEESKKRGAIVKAIAEAQAESNCNTIRVVLWIFKNEVKSIYDIAEFNMNCNKVHTVKSFITGNIAEDIEVAIYAVTK